MKHSAVSLIIQHLFQPEEAAKQNKTLPFAENKIREVAKTQNTSCRKMETCRKYVLW